MDIFPTIEKSIQWTDYAESVLTSRHVQVNLRRRDVFVPEDFLDGAQISSVLQQMCGEAVPQRVARHAFLDPCGLSSSLDRFIVNLPV